MAFDEIEEPQPALRRWVDPAVPGVKGQVIEKDVLIEFATEYGMSFLRCPISLIPSIVPAMVAVYNANPALPEPPVEEPPVTEPEDPPIDIGDLAPEGTDTVEE